MDTNKLGVGVLIQRLAGNEETVETYRESIGKTISSIRMAEEENDGDGALLIHFSDESGLAIEDRGRSCCEARYMTTDDHLDAYIGSTLLDMELSAAPTDEGENDVHEVQFLRIHTNKGTIVVETHNEHNGFYGGFCVKIRPLSRVR